MKKTGKRIITGILAASLMLSAVGCQKSANTIVELGDSEAKEEKEDDGPVDPNGPKVTEKEVWQDSLSGPDIESISIDTTMRTDYDLDSLSTYTVQFDEFDKDYIKEMCDTVFDSGEVEVFDFNNPTKKTYDALIGTYKDTLEMYDLVSDTDTDALKFGPDDYNSTGNWEMTQILESDILKREDIEDRISQMEAERDKAPETLDNDYSYMGYTGKIGGQDYYMYFGNKDFDEYLNSPETIQFNGRVITIMRNSLEGAYHGISMAEVIDETDETVADLFQDNGDTVLTARNYIDYGAEEIPAPLDQMDIKDKYIEDAESFLANLGYADYKLTGADNMRWMNDVTLGFLFKTDLPMTPYMLIENDGFILRYTLEFEGADKLERNDLTLPSYAESDTLDINSYINIMVNDDGVIGCQIYNPTKLVKTDKINEIIDNTAVQDIVKGGADDKSVWNFPAGRDVKNIELKNVKLISFPIRSSDNKEEYTYVPCYLVYSQLNEEAWMGGNYLIPPASYTDCPFLLINGIDGSFVKVEDELTDYPAGWDNGNVGYENYKFGGWPRFER